jgi:1-phosphatidylinositol-4-phosphate 5-kinase
MPASYEALDIKQMPFTNDSITTDPLSAEPTSVEGVYPNPHTLSISSSSPPRPHRAQSTTALHHPVRLPPTVPEDNAISPVQDVVAGLVGSPRRPRASTGATKPRGSAERLTEDDASWWTEEIHKRRELRRRWKEVEDENTVIIGNKVDTNHPNYVTAYNMLTGLRVAVHTPSPDHNLL